MRVIRACRELGITSVAVYSDVDRSSLHVSLADEAYPIGPLPPLNPTSTFRKDSGGRETKRAEAIHPGYGFLSENREICPKLRRAGVKILSVPRPPPWK